MSVNDGRETAQAGDWIAAGHAFGQAATAGNGSGDGVPRGGPPAGVTEEQIRPAGRLAGAPTSAEALIGTVFRGGRG